jgi:hypothetical protein
MNNKNKSMQIKKTKEQYILEANIKHKNIYDYSLIKELTKINTKVNIICHNHGIFEQSFKKHLYGNGCTKCSHEKTGKERIEKAKIKFINEANIIHTNKYDYSNSIYISATNNMIIICKIHGEFEQTPNRHLGGGGCKKCANDKTKERMTIPWEIYKADLQKVHDNKYDYSKVIWKGSDNEIIVLCKLHGDFIVTAKYHKKGRGCQICLKEQHNQYNKLNTEEFIKKSIKIWENKYDYSKTKYVDANNKVLIICNKHGEFEQLPSNHYKYGCGKCGRELNKRNIELKDKCKNEFISKANNIHKNIYDYSSTQYHDSVTKVVINCKIHGEFSITPNNHLRGKGCSECGKESSRLAKLKDYEEYHIEFIKLYGDKYDYSSIIWEGASKTINVICKKHGEFNIFPYLHKIGKECQKCSNQYSSISMDWILFMEKKYLSEIQHAKNLGEFVIPGTRYKADGYIKSLNIIFEFHGDFWHGNPEIYDKKEINPRIGITYGELYNQTIEKSKLIVEKGYNLIEIWENDWKKFIKTIKFLQHKWRKIKSQKLKG